MTLIDSNVVLVYRISRDDWSNRNRYIRVLYWWRQHCKQISSGCLEIFKKIITLLTVTVLFLFTFFNLILDAPRKLPPKQSTFVCSHKQTYKEPYTDYLEVFLRRITLVMLYLSEDDIFYCCRGSHVFKLIPPTVAIEVYHWSLIRQIWQKACLTGSSDFNIFIEIQYASCVFGLALKF